MIPLICPSGKDEIIGQWLPGAGAAAGFENQGTAGCGNSLWLVVVVT